MALWVIFFHQSKNRSTFLIWWRMFMQVFQGGFVIWHCKCSLPNLYYSIHNSSTPLVHFLSSFSFICHPSILPQYKEYRSHKVCVPLLRGFWFLSWIKLLGCALLFILNCVVILHADQEDNDWFYLVSVVIYVILMIYLGLVVPVTFHEKRLDLTNFDMWNICMLSLLANETCSLSSSWQLYYLTFNLIF